MMRIAFYAPMKPPTHPVPSGDRRVASMLMQALDAAPHRCRLASRFRSYDGAGDRRRQLRIREIGTRLAERLIRRCRAGPAADRPEVWFTYHLYHKAPDWLGLPVAHALGIPYVIAEASHAPKQRDGPWALGLEAAERAIASADLVFALNSADAACVRPLLADPDRLRPLLPFLDSGPYREAARRRDRHRRRLARTAGLECGRAWLVAAAMMRPGDKLASYRCLAAALDRLRDRPWSLLIAGDGEARADVEAAMAPLGDRVVWLGRRSEAELAGILAAADVYVWPAVNEAYGMAILEAQAAALPVVAGRTGGVPDVVAEGKTGLLVPPNDAEAFAACVRALLDDPDRRQAMADAAGQRVRRCHEVDAAGRTLHRALGRLVRG